VPSHPRVRTCFFGFPSCSSPHIPRFCEGFLPRERAAPPPNPICNDHPASPRGGLRGLCGKTRTRDPGQDANHPNEILPQAPPRREGLYLASGCTGSCENEDGQYLPRFRARKPVADRAGGWSKLHGSCYVVDQMAEVARWLVQQPLSALAGNRNLDTRLGRRFGIPRSKNQRLRRIAREEFLPLRMAALIFDRDGFRIRLAGWTKGVQSYADVVRNGDVVVVEMAAPCGRDHGVGRSRTVPEKAQVHRHCGSPVHLVEWYRGSQKKVWIECETTPGGGPSTTGSRGDAGRSTRSALMMVRRSGQYFKTGCEPSS